MTRPRISTTVSHFTRNQLEWLREQDRRTLNNMLEILISDAFADAMTKLPEDKKLRVLDTVCSSFDYIALNERP